jgi:uncharacterized protein (TIGR02246 family)
MTAEAQDIWQAIVASNAAWTSGNPRGVAPLYAEDVVMVTPGISGRVVGRDAMVDGYVEYCNQARTHSFKELEHDVDVRGDVAVATYRFAVRYEIGGHVFDDIGQEILVLSRTKDRWLVIWRTQMTLESRELELSSR